MSELDVRLVRRSRVLSQQGNDDVVLLDLDRGTYFALNDVGSRVWELCDGTRTLSDVVAALCDEFDAPPATVEADVVELAGELEEERLLVQDR